MKKKCLLFLMSAIAVVKGYSQGCDLAMVTDSLRIVTDDNVKSIVRSGNMLYLGGRFYGIGKYTGAFTGLTPAGLPVSQPSWPKVEGTVRAAIPDGNGGWFVGGKFSKIGSQYRKNIAHITAAGTLDTWAPAVNGTVYSLALCNNKVLIGGEFTQINSVSRTNCGAVDKTTAALLSWNPSANSSVYSLKLDGNHVYLGGKFTQVSSQSRNRLASVDTVNGGLNSWNPNANKIVRTIEATNDRVFIGGDFTVVGGQARSYIGSLSKTTGLADTWDPQADSSVYTLYISGSEVLAGGQFTTIGAVETDCFARIDINTGIATYTGLGISNYFSNTRQLVSAIAVDGSTVYIGGRFSFNVNGVFYANAMAFDLGSLTLSGWNPTAKGAFTTDTVYNLHVSGGNIYAGGNFSAIGFMPRKGIAAVDMSTGNITSWSPDVSYNPSVNAIAVKNGRVYVANYNGLAVVDSATGAPISFPSVNGEVMSVVADENAIYIGGAFNHVGTEWAYRVASLNPLTGALNWQGNAGNIVRSLHLNSGNLYVGGDFVSIGVYTRNHLAAIDVTSGAITSWNPNVNSPVKSVTSHGDTVFICGYFTQVGGQNREDVTGINRLTGLPINFSRNTLGAAEVVAADNEFLYVGGSFYSIGGQLRDELVRYRLSDLSLSGWTPSFATTSLAGVSSILPQNGNVMFGGDFTVMDSTGVTKFSWYKDQITTPEVAIVAPDPVCEGLSATFSANANFNNPAYEWTVNGNVMGTGQNYAYIPANGDQVAVSVHTPQEGCFTDTAAADQISIATTPVVTPAITLDAPATAAAGSSVTVTANVSNAGSQYTINWKLNNVPAGTTSVPSFSFLKNASDDQVQATLQPDMASGCYSQGSVNAAAITIADAETGIGDPVNNISGIRIYPNPVSEKMTLSGLEKNDRVELLNVLGKKIQSIPVTANDLLTIQTKALQPGSYFCRVYNEKGLLKFSGSVVKK